MSFKYFNVKNGLTTGNISLHSANSNVQANYFLGNINVTSSANLGAVGNVKITGGASGYILSTDGTGNLGWTAQGSSNIVLDSFTGNGVQTNFTLTSTPTSEDYTIINIDGVSQLHSAYTVSGANVILSSAPANGAAIEVMTFNLSGGGGGSSGSNIANGTSNVSIATSGGNVTTSVAGNANVIVATGTGVNVAGYLTATGNITSGNANLGNSAVANYFTGTLTTNAQPNITSLGTIANLTATNINLTSFKETVVAGGNTSTSISPNVATGTIFTYTANSNFTFSTLTNAVAGSSATIIITQASPGSFVLTSTMKFAGASKTLSTAAASIDIISVFYDGTTYYATLSKGYA